MLWPKIVAWGETTGLITRPFGGTPSESFCQWLVVVRTAGMSAMGACAYMSPAYCILPTTRKENPIPRPATCIMQGHSAATRPSCHIQLGAILLKEAAQATLAYWTRRSGPLGTPHATYLCRPEQASYDQSTHCLQLILSSETSLFLCNDTRLSALDIVIRNFGVLRGNNTQSSHCAVFLG